MNDLPDDLQQQVLTYVLTLRQSHLQDSRDSAWDILASLLEGSKLLPIGRVNMITISTAHPSEKRPINVKGLFERSSF